MVWDSVLQERTCERSESGEPDPERREREKMRFWTKGDFGLLGWRPVFVLVLLLPDDAPLITTPSSFGGTVWYHNCPFALALLLSVGHSAKPKGMLDAREEAKFTPCKKNCANFI